jgi:hypothetical protein
MHQRSFESARKVELPNFHFRPDLVWVRQCADCGAVDSRAWYSTRENAEAAAPSSIACRSCSGNGSIVARAWFDSVFAHH